MRSTSRTIRSALAGLMAVGVGSALLVGCAPGEVVPEGPTSIVIGTNGDMATWDPAGLPNAEMTNIYRHAPYDTLLERSLDGEEIEPNVAESWEYSEDNTLLTMQIRQGITFSDGETLDAEAVKLSFDRTAEQNGNIKVISSATVVDDYTIEFRLSAAAPTILDILTTKPSIVSPAALDDLDALALHPVGSGPYVMDDDRSTAGVQYTFVRNEDYWNADADRYPYDEITFMPLPDVTARLNALQSGQINVALIDASQAGAIESSGLELWKTPSQYVGLILGDRDGVLASPLADLRVRQAINYALDRESLVQSVLGGYGFATSQMAGAACPIPLYVEELDDYYTYDPQKARDLLAEAGYPDGLDLSFGSQPAQVGTDPALVQLLGDVGIRLQVETLTQDRVVELREAKFPVWTSQGQCGNLWTNEFPAVGGVWNPFNSTDPELAGYIAEAGTAENAGDRAEAFQNVERYMTENAWFAPFYQRETLYASTTGVQITTQFGESFPVLHQIRPAE